MDDGVQWVEGLQVKGLQGWGFRGDDISGWWCLEVLSDLSGYLWGSRQQWESRIRVEGVDGMVTSSDFACTDVL